MFGATAPLTGDTPPNFDDTDHGKQNAIRRDGVVVEGNLEGRDQGPKTRRCNHEQSAPFGSTKAFRETSDLLEGRFGREAEIIPLFGRLSSGEQQRVFAPSSARKIVIATNIAETSLTIPGIRYVIDSGLARMSRYNPRTRTRHLPAGTVLAGEALALAVVSALAFLAVAATLGFWPAVLAPGVLAVLLGYSYAKRFTWGAHAWLGVALALAPAHQEALGFLAELDKARG